MISYKNDVDSFVIVSSDSDYWGLISSLPDAHFLVMIEREKCVLIIVRKYALLDLYHSIIFHNNLVLLFAKLPERPARGASANKPVSL